MEARPQLTDPSSDPMVPDLNDGFIRLAGEGLVCRIGDVDRLAPFMVTVTSPDDHWLFVSTSGGLTCGRVDPSRALFPYETDDRLHRVGGLRGPVTLLRVGEAGALWAPLQGAPAPGTSRNLYKSRLGDRLIFEEVNEALGLTFRARWSTSRLFGLVRTVTLSRHPGHAPTRVALLDGLVDLQPALVPLPARQTMSNLVDSYTRCERLPRVPLALCALEARIVDRPEPAEALRTNLVWSVGLEGATISLREDAPAHFSRGLPVDTRTLLTGQRGAFFQATELELDGAASRTWHVVGDVHVDQRGVASLLERLDSPAALTAQLEADLADGARRLRKLVASVDGLQLGADLAQTTAHGSSALFSTMRGGVFSDGHVIPVADLRAFIKARSPVTWTRQRAFLEALGDAPCDRIVAISELREDPDLTRLVLEYLPLWFSRRHGDPSRPWNLFAIRLVDANGGRRLDWQGNWRDIFQNWETLCESYPAFSLSTVVTFLDASSADGGNPYRISRAGLDWEVPDPDDPWSHIGYWGDHQIVYLLRLLELTQRNQPGRLEALLDRAVFTYADIPYRIAPFDALLANPHETITFDFRRHHDIEARRASEGADACLLRHRDGELVRVPLVEKLLVPALSKLCNLVVDGGVWMNTQRPEWNDANNALVGWGLSVVTTAHLRRYCAFVATLLSGREGLVHLSNEVSRWLDEVLATLRAHRGLLTRRDIGDNARHTILAELGGAFSRYREALYTSGLSSKTDRTPAELVELLNLARDYLDHTLRANRREDGLFHGYNVMVSSADGQGIGLERLPLMLEGQVALLDSGLIPPAETADMLDALFASALYREDQQSFVLYPPVVRPSFLDKNTIPRARAASLRLLGALLDAGDTRLVIADVQGRLRFAPDLTNARDLEATLDALAAEPDWMDAIARDREEVSALWEEVFHHHTFTGRSGTMHGHEGIGCIYWHMVGKLHLAVASAHAQARAMGAAPSLVRRLAEHYHAIRRGLGPAKSAALQGAFPTDPHSYTPPHRGAQQPGMTGQAKEAVLVRWRELGVHIDGGRLRFSPVLLPEAELLTAPDLFETLDVAGVERRLEVPAGAFAFTFCQVPILYVSELNEGASERVRVVCTWADGAVEDSGEGRDNGASGSLDGLSPAATAAVLGRTGQVERVVVHVPRQTFWRG